MMYTSPYFRSAFFPPMYHRYSPNPLFPQVKTGNAVGASTARQQMNTSYAVDTHIARQQVNTSNSVGASIARQQANTGSSMGTPTSISQNEDRHCDDKPIFEIFGIKLYFDDLLILGLLFFLYSEGVEDQELFLALILLLFS